MPLAGPGNFSAHPGTQPRGVPRMAGHPWGDAPHSDPGVPAGSGGAACPDLLPTGFARDVLPSPRDTISCPADANPPAQPWAVSHISLCVSEANLLNSSISKPMSRVILTAIIIVKAL